MTRVIVEIDPAMRRGCEPVARVAELAELAVPGIELHCPRCGCFWFTVEATQDGGLVLACGKEPTCIRVLIPQESEVTNARVRTRHPFAIRFRRRHLLERPQN